MRQILVVTAIFSICAGQSYASASTFTFQEGDGGAFSDTDATYTDPFQTTTNFGGSDVLLGLSASDTDHNSGGRDIFIKFAHIFGNDPGQIPLGSSIASATLKMRTTANSVNDKPAPGPIGIQFGFGVFSLLTDFDETTLTGSSLASMLVGLLPVDTFQPLTSETGILLDVTSSLNAWSDSTLDNYGWIIRCSGIGGTATEFYSDDAAVISVRPELTVNIVPEPATFTLLGLGGVIWVGRRRRIIGNVWRCHAKP